ncbi:acetyltransferase [Gramella jeungdoensis]|uniref:Acetyltransferase n=1 Tax=Gramella jeungdoensis TaxID=708091 RepID=A0ABT0Z409_9FLAO|nr:acetyltransferase [Gramella jeungdoensis]MCM8570470.1 acetyltransferase [Gramella jeungdoensis]
MIIYGASGHAKVIVDIIKSMDSYSVDFVLDDDPEVKELVGFEVKHQLTDEMKDQKLVLAIGNNQTRYKLASKLQQSYCSALIHKSAVISEDIDIREGSVVMANAVINSSTVIGKHCIINSGAIVEHDVKLEDFVHISPNATVTGNVVIGEGSQIGAGATVIPGVQIGKWVTVGAGAIVIEDIPDFAVVVGNPAKIIKFNRIENE